MIKQNTTTQCNKNNQKIFYPNKKRENIVLYITLHDNGIK